MKNRNEIKKKGKTIRLRESDGYKEPRNDKLKALRNDSLDQRKKLSLLNKKMKLCREQEAKAKRFAEAKITEVNFLIERIRSRYGQKGINEILNVTDCPTGLWGFRNG